MMLKNLLVATSQGEVKAKAKVTLTSYADKLVQKVSTGKKCVTGGAMLICNHFKKRNEYESNTAFRYVIIKAQILYLTLYYKGPPNMMSKQMIQNASIPDVVTTKGNKINYHIQITDVTCLITY